MTMDDIQDFSFLEKKYGRRELKFNIYRGPCILRLPMQSEKCGVKLKVVLKRRDIYIEYIRIVSLMVSLKIE